MSGLLILVSIVCTSISAMPTGDIPPSGAILTPFGNAGEIKNQKIAQIINPKSLIFAPSFPDSGRKEAVTEYESLLSKADTAYSTLQQFVADFVNPKPIVDTIQEHEKYGNDGGKIRNIGVAVVGGFEGVSNLLNAAVDVPFEAAKQIARKLTSSAGAVGAKLAG